MNKSTITTIVIVVIVIIAGGFYFWTMGNNPSTSSSPLSSQSAAGAASASVGINELALLNQVSSIKINPSFFSSSIFTSLIDRVQQVRAVNVGGGGFGGSGGVGSSRADPFAPVSGVPSPFPQSQTQTVTRPVSPIK
ncbi:MAG: hypothetical protein WCO48_01110 [Candidatus Taylorbacteria bacterium]